LVKVFWNAVADTFSDAWSDRQPLVRMPDGTVIEAGSTIETDDGEIRVLRIEYRIKELVGVAAPARLGGDILAEALGSPDPVGYIAQEVEKIAEVNWQKVDDNPWVRSQAGFAGQRELHDALSYLRANGEPPWEEAV
jgi:hypothetical protein